MIFIKKIKSNLLKDILKVLSGNVIAQGIGFLIIMFLSRTLGPEKYGLYALFITIFDFLRQLGDFGISVSYVKVCSEKRNKGLSLADLFYTTFISKIILSLLLFIVVFFLSNKISIFFFKSLKYSLLIRLLGVSILFAQLFNVVVVHLQAMQEFKKYSFFNIINQVVRALTIFIIAVFFSVKNIDFFVEAYLASFFIVVLIFPFVFFDKLKKLLKSKFKFDEIKNIYRMGSWIFLSGLAVIIIMRLNVWMLQKLTSEYEVGIYSTALQLAMVFPLITASIQATLLPKVGDYLKNHSIKEYVNRITSFVKYILLILIILLLSSSFIVTLVFSKKYVESIPVFRVIISAVFLSAFINPISLVFYYKDKAHFLTLLNWIQLFVNLILAYILIPRYSALGAAVATLGVNILGAIYIYVYVVYFLSKQENENVA